MDFYQTSLRKFVQFLGQRADEPIGEITKQDVVAFRQFWVGQVSAKTVNHNLKALKMLFKSARRDSAITEDPTEFVETIRKERGIKIKRPFTLQELRSVLDLANDEWRSMILFGLYTGQRLGDIATLRLNNLDLARGELRLSTRKTGQAIVLPLAVSLRRQIELLLTSSNEPSASSRTRINEWDRSFLYLDSRDQTLCCIRLQLLLRLHRKSRIRQRIFSLRPWSARRLREFCATTPTLDTRSSAHHD